MTKYILLLSFSVSICNIALNYFTSRAAFAAEHWSQVFASRHFAMASVVAASSLVLVASLYFVSRGNQFGLANGILVVAATSIIGGTVFGYGFLGNRVHWSEWVLFFLILLFVGIRFLLAGTSQV
jgi:hypothetical protein